MAIDTAEQFLPRGISPRLTKPVKPWRFNVFNTIRKILVTMAPAMSPRSHRCFGVSFCLFHIVV